MFQFSFVSYDIINELSLLITVKGKNESLTPYLLTAHLDVVPVIQEEWIYPGFGATEADDDSMVYARGAMDDKGNLIAIMGALRFMLNKNIQPQRGFFIGFGHDEEVSGKNGAQQIANELKRRGVNKLDFLVDEGTPVMQNLFPGINKPIAGISVSEKGYMLLNLSVHTEGGHSSVPPKQSSIGILSEAVRKLESNPHPIIFDELSQNFINSLSLEMAFPFNVLTSNMWLTKPLVPRYVFKGIAKALLQTTTAVTMIQGGIKENVIPPSAWVLVNHRIHPKQTINEIIELDRKLIDDDRVKITLFPDHLNPHPVSPHRLGVDRPFTIVHKTSRQIFPGAIPAPMTLFFNTDTGQYLEFTDHIFRMWPYKLDLSSELRRMHGRDERLSKSNFEAALNFYYHLMLNADEDWTTEGHSHSSEL